MSLMTEAIDKHVSKAKASPYTKRWWTKDLTALGSEYAQQRNQTSRARRQGFNTTHLERMSKRRYHTALRKTEKNALEELLHDGSKI